MILRPHRLVPGLLYVLPLSRCGLARIILDLCIGWCLFFPFVGFTAEFRLVLKGDWGVSRARLGVSECRPSKPRDLLMF
jgi:hypothetical protein